MKEKIKKIVPKKKKKAVVKKTKAKK